MSGQPLTTVLHYDAVVLGAGPAGVASAAGLARLGYRVALLGRGRVPAIEGMSPRTIARLRAAGLDAAADCARGPARRLALWGGEGGIRGSEYIVDRARLDAALWGAARVLNIDCQLDTAQTVAMAGARWRVGTGQRTLSCRVLIEARGRCARRAEQRGPHLVAAMQTWTTAMHSEIASTVVALEDGWCWFAADGQGQLALQFVGAPQAAMNLNSRLAAAIAAVPDLSIRLAHATPQGPIRARAAVARLSTPSRYEGYMRVGDAAVAMDPLSGHGIYEALGSAQVAVAAANTYLSGGDWSPVARFINERAGEVWQRALAAAAHFYRAQAEYCGTLFWRKASAAYAVLAAPVALPIQRPHVEMRPVLNGQRIELRRVWVTPARPRGIWQIDGQELRVGTDLSSCQRARPEAAARAPTIK